MIGMLYILVNLVNQFSFYASAVTMRCVTVILNQFYVTLLFAMKPRQSSTEVLNIDGCTKNARFFTYVAQTIPNTDKLLCPRPYG